MDEIGPSFMQWEYEGEGNRNSLFWSFFPVFLGLGIMFGAFSSEQKYGRKVL